MADPFKTELIKEPVQLKASDVKPLRDKILHEDQGGECWICGNEPKTACLDHHHKKRIKGTGLIRGVLCSSCNIFIAKSENNCIRYGISTADLPTILRKVADYIEKDHYPFIHPSEKPPVPKLKKSSYNALKRVYNQKKAFPPYPRSGKLTKPLESIYEDYDMEPEFYAK